MVSQFSLEMEMIVEEDLSQKGVVDLLIVLRVMTMRMG
jgi:hypothetical protein